VVSVAKEMLPGACCRSPRPPQLGQILTQKKKKPSTPLLRLRAPLSDDQSPQETSHLAPCMAIADFVSPADRDIFGSL